jgi:alpha-tubulin suppressor-like RCC1 family protein
LERQNTQKDTNKMAASTTELFGFGANYYRNMGEATRKSLAHSPEEKIDVYTFDESPWGTEDDPVVQVACSASASFFLTKNGKMYSCGTMHGRVRPKLTRKIIQLPLKCAQLAAGRHYVLARMEGGLAVCSWGAGHFGQLGLGNDSAPCVEHPTVIEALLPHVVGSPISSVAAGYWHAMAVTKSGQLFSWGCNRNAQCGMKPQRDPPTVCLPNLVQFDGGHRQITKIAAGRSHSVALDATGAVYCWGACQYGQCGQVSRRRGGIAPPKHVEALTQVTIAEIAAGDSHTLALTGGGRLFAWGGGYEGQLGFGAIVQLNPKPKLVGDLDFVAIQAGEKWKTQQKVNGHDEDHQDDDDDEDGSGVAPNLSEIPRIMSIHATGNSSVAISTSGHAYSWGCNDVGNIGIPKPESGALTFAEPGMPLPKTSTLRQLHTMSFDSTHNVALPMRIGSLSHVHLTSVSGSPTFMWCLGRQRTPDEEDAIVGRTLYEVQEGKRWKILRTVRSKSDTSGDVETISNTNNTTYPNNTTPTTAQSVTDEPMAEAADSISSIPVDPPEVIEGSEIEGDDTEAGSTSRHSQGFNLSATEQGGLRPPMSPKPPSGRMEGIMTPSPSKSKRRFTLKKLAKMARRASLGSGKSEN